MPGRRLFIHRDGDVRRRRRCILAVLLDRVQIQGNLLINREDGFHLGLELRIPPLQIVSDFVRLQFLRHQDPVNGGLGRFCQSRKALLRGMFAHMKRQGRTRPQLGGTAELLGFGASHRHYPGLGIVCKDRLARFVRRVFHSLRAHA